MARPAKIKQNGIITYEVCPGCGAEVGVLHGKIDGEHCKLYWCECDNGRGLLAIAPGCSCTQEAAEQPLQSDVCHNCGTHYVLAGRFVDGMKICSVCGKRR